MTSNTPNDVIEPIYSGYVPVLLGIGSTTAFLFFGRFRDWFRLFRNRIQTFVQIFIASEKILESESIPCQLRTKYYKVNCLPLS